jgi:hypothetical protein
MLLVQTVRIPKEGIEAFRRFEATVLPLLAEHGGRLERRLRTLDGETEVHVVSFSSLAGFDAYRADPRRQEGLHLLHESQATTELLQVVDVTDEPG